MKTLGLIGGMSWESTAEYYRIINELVKEKLGSLHSAKCILYSFDFEDIEILQNQGKWHELTRLMIGAAQTVESAGADCIVICTNTMHKSADAVQDSITVPLIHIVDATAEKILQKGIHRVALLGTRFTMEQGFYKKRLQDKYGISVMTPPEKGRKTVHTIIYRELCLGKIRTRSKQKLSGIIKDLVASGAEGIILGCTELPLLLAGEKQNIPVFDTTFIHAQAAVEYALSQFSP
jgi:aspartate racemase